jgi:glutaconate CoA-transferase subunit A
MQGSTVIGLNALAARVRDGAKLAVPADYSGVAMSATFALIRRRVRGLHLVTVPASGLQADLLIGAGCVAVLETAAITLGELGSAPRFTEAVRCGAIALRDATCPAIHAGLQAAEKGLPFMPLRGLIESDLVKHRTDWKIIDNPFEPGDPIVVLHAIRPDVALFHAPLADREGNVWIGRRRELMTMAHAAAETLVTVEEIREESLLDDEAMAAGTIPSLYVAGIAEAKHGVWPLAFGAHYAADDAALQRYVEAARTEDGFNSVLQGWLELQAPAVAAAE